MRALKRRDAETIDDRDITDTGIADECEAFLSGTLAESMRSRGLSPAVSTWLNETAHAPEAEIRRLARDLDPDAPEIEERTRCALARAVVGALTDRELRDVQNELLVPLELGLGSSVLSPRRLVELVGRALYL